MFAIIGAFFAVAFCLYAWAAAYTFGSEPDRVKELVDDPVWASIVVIVGLATFPISIVAYFVGLIAKGARADCETNGHGGGDERVSKAVQTVAAPPYERERQGDWYPPRMAEPSGEAPQLRWGRCVCGNELLMNSSRCGRCGSGPESWTASQL
jgi:hypothetical protein